MKIVCVDYSYVNDINDEVESFVEPLPSDLSNLDAEVIARVLNSVVPAVLDLAYKVVHDDYELHNPKVKNETN